jgi:hypothetical protein
MNNFVIAIPSKGRLTGFTFSLLKNLSIPVYVYVDEKESDAYEDYYPEFTIVPHNKKNIGAIRHFIQEEQAKAGNTVLMLDDDILGFYDEEAEYSVSLKKILNTIEDLLNKGNDAIGFRTIYQENDTSKIFKMSPDVPYFFAAFVLSPKVYMNGIRFTEEDTISEDSDFLIQVELHKDTVKTFMLPYGAKYLCNDFSTHFNNEWRNKASIKLYEKYGNLVNLYQNGDTVKTGIIYNNIKYYKEHGLVYTKASNNVLVSMYGNKFIDEDFMLKALETCCCKKDSDGKYCFDWDYDGYDGSEGTHEALEHGYKSLVVKSID